MPPSEVSNEILGWEMSWQNLRFAEAWAAIGPRARDLAELFQGKFGTLQLCDVWTF